MAPDDDPAFEPEQEMLADRLDRLEHPPVDALCDTGHLGARVGRLDLEPLPDERLQTARSTVKGVALGHCGQLRSAPAPERQATRVTAVLLVYIAASEAARRPAASLESSG